MKMDEKKCSVGTASANKLRTVIITNAMGKENCKFGQGFPPLACSSKSQNKHAYKTGMTNYGIEDLPRRKISLGKYLPNKQLTDYQLRKVERQLGGI